jgi:hypothetical protein
VDVVALRTGEPGQPVAARDLTRRRDRVVGSDPEPEHVEAGPRLVPSRTPVGVEHDVVDDHVDPRERGAAHRAPVCREQPAADGSDPDPARRVEVEDESVVGVGADVVADAVPGRRQCAEVLVEPDDDPAIAGRSELVLQFVRQRCLTCARRPVEEDHPTWRHRQTADVSYSDAMRRSTRSSWDLNGSLHRTVRCAWSLSFRCTQSTV